MCSERNMREQRERERYQQQREKHQDRENNYIDKESQRNGEENSYNRGRYHLDRETPGQRDKFSVIQKESRIQRRKLSVYIEKKSNRGYRETIRAERYINSILLRNKPLGQRDIFGIEKNHPDSVYFCEKTSKQKETINTE